MTSLTFTSKSVTEKVSVDIDNRFLLFSCYSKAVFFAQEITKHGYEIGGVKLVQKFTEGEGEKPKCKVESQIYVYFVFNPYEQHDVALINKLQKKYKKFILGHGYSRN